MTNESFDYESVIVLKDFVFYHFIVDQIKLDDINRTAVPPINDLEPRPSRGSFLTNGTVMVAMAVLMVVIDVLALIVCRLTPINRNSIFLSKAQRADEIAVVQ